MRESSEVPGIGLGAFPPRIPSSSVFASCPSFSRFRRAPVANASSLPCLSPLMMKICPSVL